MVAIKMPAGIFQSKPGRRFKGWDRILGGLDNRWADHGNWFLNIIFRLGFGWCCL